MKVAFAYHQTVVGQKQFLSLSHGEMLRFLGTEEKIDEILQLEQKKVDLARDKLLLICPGLKKKLTKTLTKKSRRKGAKR